MDGVVEVITGRERRRRWSTEEKLRIVAQSEEHGAGVRAVAARQGVCESLVFTWRRPVRDGVLVAPDMPVFMPVRMLELGGDHGRSVPPRAAPGARVSDEPPAIGSGRSSFEFFKLQLQLVEQFTATLGRRQTRGRGRFGCRQEGTACARLDAA